VYLVSASLVVHKNERGKGNKEKSGGETSLKICITLLMEEKYLVSELLVVHTKKGGKGKKKKNLLEKLHTLLTEELYLVSASLVVFVLFLSQCFDLCDICAI